MLVKAYLITLADHLCALVRIYFPRLSVKQRKKRKRAEKKERDERIADRSDM